MNDESQTKERNGVTASPIGSFFANAKKKMEKVASTLDAKATALFDKKSSTAPRCVVPTDVYTNALIYEAMRVFVATFDGSEKPEAHPETVRAFCASVRMRMYSLELWLPFSNIQMEAGLSDALSECIERWVTTELYSHLFAAEPASIERDKILFDRLSSLVFLTPTHLEIPKKYWRPAHWKSSAEELFRLGKTKSPLDKLDVIRAASQIILDSLVSCDGPEGGAGADVFLPVITLILIMSNPPQLHSSIDFIRNYHNKAYRGTQMEYFLVSLETAVAFAERMTATDLADLSQEEMDNLMEKSLKGEVVPSWNIVDREEWVVVESSPTPPPAASSSTPSTPSSSTGGTTTTTTAIPAAAAAAAASQLSPKPPRPTSKPLYNPPPRFPLLGLSFPESPGVNFALFVRSLRSLFTKAALIVPWTIDPAPDAVWVANVVEAANDAGLFVIFVAQGDPPMDWKVDLIIVADHKGYVAKTADDIRSGCAALYSLWKQ